MPPQGWPACRNRRCFVTRAYTYQAPCCGRFTCRYQLEPDDGGAQRCLKCRALPDRVPWALGQQRLAWQYLQLEIQKAAMPTPPLTAPGVVPNPSEAPAYAPALPPWRARKADGEEIAPPPKRMRTSSGAMEVWHAHENCGWAWFTGYGQWVFVHLSDIDSPPQAGDPLTGHVRTMSDGKLQAFDVKRIVENREGGLSAALGHGQLEQTPVQGTEPCTQPAVTGWQQTAAWPHAPTAYAHEVLPQQPAVHAQLEVQSGAAQHQDRQVLGMYAQQQSPVPQAATLAQRAECEIPDSSQDNAEQSPSQTSTAPADYGGPLPPTPSALPTPVGFPVALGPTNPQEAPAGAKVAPPRRHQTVDEGAPPLRRRKPNGVLELWHPYKAAVFA